MSSSSLTMQNCEGLLGGVIIHNVIGFYSCTILKNTYSFPLGEINPKTYISDIFYHLKKQTGLNPSDVLILTNSKMLEEKKNGCPHEVHCNSCVYLIARVKDPFGHETLELNWYQIPKILNSKRILSRERKNLLSQAKTQASSNMFKELWVCGQTFLEQIEKLQLEEKEKEKQEKKEDFSLVDHEWPHLA